jgi:hypothetical protein
MISRRALLGLGTAGVTVAVLQASAHTLGSALLGEPRRLTRAVFDERFQEAQSFARVFSARGVPTSAIRGDVAAVWYQDLKGVLIEQRLPLVGLTDRAALFCLEELARDVGMKVRGRIDHTVDARGVASHRATGPAAWLAGSRRLGAEPGFGERAATLLANPTWHGSSHAAQKRSGPFSAGNETTLVSWWIA